MFLYKSLKQRDEEEDVQVQSGCFTAASALVQWSRLCPGSGQFKPPSGLALSGAAAFPCNNSSVAALGLLGGR